MQLAARRVLLQLEVPLGHLFDVKAHQPSAIASLVDLRLQSVREGVGGSHATRTCAICLEQLFCAYGVMLLVQEAPFQPGATPTALAADLAGFERLLSNHCAAGLFASRSKAAARVRAKAMLSLLGSFHALLERLLRPAAGAANAPPAPDAAETDAIMAVATELWMKQHALTRPVLARLLSKCRVPATRGRRATALLDACEARGRQAGSMQADAADAASACAHFFATVAEALQMGRRKFTIVRLIELQQSATRRWE